jgi:hypothetical protein
MLINFDNLKRSDPDLYKIVVDSVGLRLTGEHEMQPIEFMGLAPDTRLRLSDWHKQRETDVVRGTERLREYMGLGLVDNQSNTEKIVAYLLEHCDSTMSVENVDKAVHGLGDQLEWTKEETKPVEVLMTLSDGTTQLPLEGTTPSMLRRASLPQLHDWHRRKQKESPVARIAGRFAGSIF